MRKTQTLEDVKNTLETARKTRADAAMARAMVKHGNLTPEARTWVAMSYGLED